MNYPSIVLGWFFVYVSACLLAAWLGRRSTAEKRQALFYALVIAFFQWRFGGQAHRLGPIIYWLAALADAGFIVSARYIRAPSSRWIAIFGVPALVLDIVFFVTAATGHRLPGIIYFAGSNTLETLQVGALLVLSGPVYPAFIKAWHLLGRERHLPWKDHRRLNIG